MALDRTAFNALIDDDGSNTVGTPWNKAQIDAVLLDPTDAELARLDAAVGGGTFPGSITLGGDLVFTGNNKVRRNTSDGFDTGYLFLTGGGDADAPRAATLVLGGNESAFPGEVRLFLGNVAGARLLIQRSDGQTAVTLAGSTGAITFTSSLDSGWTFNSTHANGPTLTLQVSGTTMGTLGPRPGGPPDLLLSAPVGDMFLHAATGQVRPLTDNANSLGGSSLRWSAVYAVNGTIQTSDARQKVDVAPSDLGLAFLARLRPVRYHWRNGDVTRAQYGLLAQELLAVEGGSAFVYGTEAESYGTSYTALVAPIIAAIHELTARLAALEERTT